MLNKKRAKGKIIIKSKSFLLLLYDILNDSFCKEFIHWNSEGSGIIIDNINNFCKNILPKYFNHNNYSSFIRQLNIYGFHKMKGKIKNGEEYINEKFNMDSTKIEIRNLIKQNKRNLHSNYINNFKTNDLNSLNINYIFNNQNFFLKYLLDKNEENKQYLIELKNEVAELKNQNINLNNQLDEIHNNIKVHNRLFQKVLMLKSKKNIKKVVNFKKTKNLKELFTKYLYYLKIYSPYADIIKKKNNIYKEEKVESFNLIKINNTKKDIFNNLNNIKNININNENIFEEFENKNQELKFFDVNYLNINSNSLSNFEIDFK